ncbi:MAG: hypothetical protein RLZZ450_5489, partial [Pseudomonadota bacterium]
MLGWTLHIPLLTEVSPGLASMKPNTALGFLFAGASLLLARGRTTRALRYAPLLGGAVLLLGGATLLEYLFSWDAGIDQLLFADPESPRFPGRMSPISALLFVMLGSALLLLDRPLRRARGWPSEFLALLIGALSLLVLLGYLYGVDVLYAVPTFSSIALHTALGFALSAAALLLARPETGAFMKRMTSQTPAGLLCRQLLPGSIVVPCVLGWLQLKGQRAGWYGTEVGLALFAASSVIWLSALTWLTASALERAGRERLQNDMLRRTGFRAARMMAWEADLATGALRVSENAHEVLGLLPSSPFDRLEQGISIIHVDDQDAITQALEQTARDGVTTDRRFRIVRQDTHATAWLEWRSVARVGSDGATLVGGVLLDIDDAVQREGALRVSEARYRMQFESAPEAILTYDVDRGSLVEVNENAERLFGYDRQTLAR